MGRAQNAGEPHTSPPLQVQQICEAVQPLQVTGLPRQSTVSPPQGPMSTHGSFGQSHTNDEVQTRGAVQVPLRQARQRPVAVSQYGVEPLRAWHSALLAQARQAFDAQIGVVAAHWFEAVHAAQTLVSVRQWVVPASVAQSGSVRHWTHALLAVLHTGAADMDAQSMLPTHWTQAPLAAHAAVGA